MNEKTDVLLVNPTRVGADSYLNPPFHLMYLKKALNDAGFSVELVNVHEQYCRAVDCRDNHEHAPAIKRQVEEEAIDAVAGREYRLLGIGGICPSYDFAERLAAKVKAAKDVPIIIGGSLGMPLKELWLEHTAIDYLCEGDGEKLIVELVQALGDDERIRQIAGLYWRADEGWQGNPPELPGDLDYIAAPDIREIDYEFYMQVQKEWINRTLPPSLQLGAEDRVWPVVLTRGCVYDCLFCFHFNRRHRRHSIEYVIEHLTRLNQDFGVTVIQTWDDLIMGNPKWFMALCDALAASPLDLRIFTTGGKANLVTSEMAAKMIRAGFFRISYGIESGSQPVLDEMKKGATVEQNRQAIEVSTRAGLFVHANIVLGMPGETRETLAETLAFLVDVVRHNELSRQNISCAFATGYPGTQLFDHMLEQGVVEDVRDYIRNVRGVVTPEPILCQLTERDFEEFIQKLDLEATDACLARKGMPVRRFVHRALRSKCSRSAIGVVVPRKIKDAILRLFR